MTQTTPDALRFDAAVEPLVKYMPLVDGYRQSLQRLQDLWDQLTLLGQMSGIATDITATAAEFRALTNTLLAALAQRLHASTVHRMQAQAQVAIDILVRNLFERTADVGFLATDTEVCSFLRASAGGADDLTRQRAALRTRFQAYVAKYSVYDDVVVLTPDGRVCARLDERVAADHCQHPLVAHTLRGDTPYVESFGPIDVLGGRRGLVYSAAIRAPHAREVLGILCLSFRFDDEMATVFQHLAPVGPCAVAVLRDAQGQVLASADPWHIPVGARLPASGSKRATLFFGGREYLAVSVTATGYQGYAGPGWDACTLVPLDQAFRDQSAPSDSAAALPPGSLDNRNLFADELRSIPLQARQIQRGLERSVWNGEVRGRKRSDAGENGGFGAALLQQVTATGERIKNVIEDAIGDLQQSAVASILDEARDCAVLAIDIMDRNLYERANDCRWWALDGSLQRALGDNASDAAALAQAGEVLAHINSLYTVYHSLLLLDGRGHVVAASNPAGRASLGQPLAGDWVRAALQLRDGQAHVRSAFAASPLYGDQPTYVYAAAVKPANGTASDAAVGAVAVVFDSGPQFEAMLHDTLPRSPDGSVMPQAAGLFVTRGGRVVSSTDTARFPLGQPPAFALALAAMKRGESRHWVLAWNGAFYAAGASMSRGYREYNNDDQLHDDDVASVVLIQLGMQPEAEATASANVQARAVPAPLAAHGKPQRQLASFYCGGEWLALDASGVIEAIDVPRLTALPGSANAIAGVVMYEKEAVPVIDLRTLRNPSRTAAQVLNDGPAPVILCQSPGRRTFGVRVDELGQVMDIEPDAIRPMLEYLSTHDRHAEGLLSFKNGPAGQADRTLTLLSVDRLAPGMAAGR